MGRACLWVCAVLLGAVVAFGTPPAGGMAAAGAGVSGNAARFPRPDPVAEARYLAAQRAGFGSPAQAAQLGARAQARAMALRSQPAIAGAPDVRSFPASAGGWSPLGPAPVSGSYFGGRNSGRVDGVAVVQSGPNAGEIFAGTAGGGVWSSSDNGASWTSHTDHVPTGLAIGAIAVDPANPSIVYAGTGEANNCGDCFYGGGVLKSTDGGNSWSVENPSGLFTGVDFASIAVDPNDSQRLYATTTDGFYVSGDGGASWAHPSGSGSFDASSTGLALDPTTTPTTVYFASQFVGIQKSTDGGVNFTTLAGGLPALGQTTALGIGSGSAGHQTLYAATELEFCCDPNGSDLSMYKSTDGGTIWHQLTIPAYANTSYAYGSAPSNQTNYDNAIAVDPDNPDHVIAGGIAAVESTDGGSSWTNINGQNFYGAASNVLHPDFHAIVFKAAGGAILGSDGGVYGYAGGGRTGVSDMNTNQDTAQVYPDLGIYDNGSIVLAGLQDNGTVRDDRSRRWPQADTGDGSYSAINPFDYTQQFTVINGDVFTTDDSWVSTSKIDPPGGRSGNFSPPLAIVPTTPDADPLVYYGGSDLWRTTNPSDKAPAWRQLTSVGANVSAIAPAPSDRNVLYVGFDDGTLLVSTNAGSASPTFAALPARSGWITHITVNPSNPGSIALTLTAGNDHTRHLPPMVETGQVALAGAPTASFTDITGDLPNGVASNSVVFDRGALVVATDVGIFTTSSPNSGSTAWSTVGSGLPNVQVYALSVDSAGDLFAGTHGRGLWKLTAPGSAAPRPKCTLKPVRPRRHPRVLEVRISCSKDVRLRLGGKVIVIRGHTRRAFHLSGVGASVSAGRMLTLRIKLSRRARAELKRGARESVKLTLNARTMTGGHVQVHSRIRRLRR